MKRLVFCSLAAALSLMPVSPIPAAELWSQWRGTAQDGAAPAGDFPTQWTEEQAVKWSIDLAGTGGSTPVLADNKLFLTCGVDGKNHIQCYDVATGKQLWSVDAGADKGGKHRKGSGANPSPVTDGKQVFGYFRSGNVVATDTNGKVLWTRNLQAEFGEDTLWWDLGTSPLLTDDALVIAVMQTGPSYVVALNKQTGDVLWRTERVLDAPEEAAQSYATPLLTEIDGQPIVAVMGADHLTLHRLNDGKEVGRLGGFNPAAERYFRSISSPVIAGDIIICPYARGATLTGVNMKSLMQGAGDKAIVWFRDDLGADVPTPAARDGRVYVCGDKGVVTAINAQDGETLWEVKLPASRHAFSSSPLLAGDKLYLTREDATTFVVGPVTGDKAKVVAENPLKDTEPFTVASLVPYESGFVLRTRGRLYRLAQ